MAGSPVIVTRNQPSDFQVTTWTLHSPQHDKYPILVADREIAIDSIRFYTGGNPSTAQDLKFVYAPAPNLPNYGTPISGQTDLLLAAKNLATSGAPLIWDTTVPTSGFEVNVSNNRVPAGNMVWLIASGNINISTNILVQLRWRSQY